MRGDGAAVSEPRWYAIRHHGHYGAVARAGLLREGFEVHWPRLVLRKLRQPDVLDPVFPGILFARFDASDPAWGVVLHVPRVAGVLGRVETGQPVPVERGYVEALLALAGGHDGVIDCTAEAPGKHRRRPEGERLEEGATVMLNDVAATVLRDDGRERVQLLVGALRVSVRHAQIALVTG